MSSDSVTRYFFSDKEFTLVFGWSNWITAMPSYCHQHKRELMSTTHTYPWLIPITTWCRPFLFVTTNILLIKSKWKLESRATPSASPCHHVTLVASIAVAPTPGRERARDSFSREPERVNRTAPAWVASSLDDRDNIVDHVVCLKTEFLWHTVLSNENGEFYTYGIYPYLNRSVCLLMGSPTWWRFSFCSSGSSLVCSVMTWHTARARISNVRSPI